MHTLIQYLTEAVLLGKPSPVDGELWEKDIDNL